MTYLGPPDTTDLDPVSFPETCVPYLEQHYPVAYWAALWGFSPKTVRQWFNDEFGVGILRHANTGRRRKRDYVTITIAASGAARVYHKHIGVNQ